MIHNHPTTVPGNDFYSQCRPYCLPALHGGVSGWSALECRLMEASRWLVLGAALIACRPGSPAPRVKGSYWPISIRVRRFIGKCLCQLSQGAWLCVDTSGRRRTCTRCGWPSPTCRPGNPLASGVPSVPGVAVLPVRANRTNPCLGDGAGHLVRCRL